MDNRDAWYFKKIVPKKRSIMCIADLEFDSGPASLVRVWDSRGFTRSLGPIKYTFWKMGFLESKKKYMM